MNVHIDVFVSTFSQGKGHSEKGNNPKSDVFGYSYSRETLIVYIDLSFGL